MGGKLLLEWGEQHARGTQTIQCPRSRTRLELLHREKVGPKEKDGEEGEEVAHGVRLRRTWKETITAPLIRC